MHKQYKIVVCDLDNTLVDSKKHISQETIQYMIELQEKGYFVIIASGRYIHEIEPVAEAIKIKEHKGIVIACNGFEVYDYRDDSYHHFSEIKSDEAKALVDLAKKHECSTYLYQDDSYYFVQTKGFKRVLRVVEKLFPILRKVHPKLNHGINRYNDMIFVDEDRTFDCDFQKLCFISYVPKNIIELQEEIHQLYPNTYHFFYENKFVTEISKNNVSKMHAVKYVCEKYNYSMEEVIAFGDNGNDSLLLQAAGRGVTMKNAASYIRKQARYMTDKTCDEDGVMDYLKKLEL